MTNILVNPPSLLTIANTIITIASAVQKAGDLAWRSASGAPSYDGQFGPKVRALGQAALARAKKQSVSTNLLSSSLSKRAKAFQVADSAAVMGVQANAGLFNVYDPVYLRILSIYFGLTIAQVLLLLRLGTLRIPIGLLPWGKLPWWIIPPWRPGSTDEKDKTKVETGEIDSGAVSDKKSKSEKSIPIENCALDQDNYTDTMGENGKTIAETGCLITCVAIIARYNGADITPVDVNSTIKNEKGGYSGKSSNIKSWSDGTYVLEKYTDKDFSDKVISNSKVADTINSGNQVIIHVIDYYHDAPYVEGKDGHWVVAYGIDDNGDYLCLDPATGKPRTYPKHRLHPKNNNVAFIQN